jgi:hypothetical protein
VHSVGHYNLHSWYSWLSPLRPEVPSAVSSIDPSPRRDHVPSSRAAICCNVIFAASAVSHRARPCRPITFRRRIRIPGGGAVTTVLNKPALITESWPIGPVGGSSCLRQHTISALLIDTNLNQVIRFDLPFGGARRRLQQ